MTRLLFPLLALALIAPALSAQQLPPPRNPAGGQPDAIPQGPVLVPPQNAPQPAPRDPIDGQAAKKTPAQLRAVVAALRQGEKDRKQARIDRMNQFKAARAAEQQKLYQDWHDRYVSDAPVRVEYYRALASAYQSQPAFQYGTTPYFYAAGPPVIFPPVYAPVVATPVYYYQPFAYGRVFSWGW
jgi:hypothetical protein